MNGNYDARFFPGGYARPSMNVGTTLPPRAISGNGSFVTDENGHKVLDLNNNFGSNIHGHAHPDLTAIMDSVLKAGVSFGLPTKYELEHATRLIARIDGAEQVKYAVSGTEAVMNAVRFARAWTGRSHVIAVRGAFHGHSDLMLALHGVRGRRGVPEGTLQDLILIDLNDIDALAKSIAAHSEDLAAIVIDLMPNYTGLIKVDQEFAQLARSGTRDCGACLIFDEIVNFRHATGGLQALYGIVPDMTVVGKLIGGGFPIGAVVGSRKIMTILDPANASGVIHAGTFAANPLAMAAGALAMDLYDAGAVARLNALGERLREGLRQSTSGDGRWVVRGFGSLARLLSVNPAAVDAKRFWWHCYEAGVLMTPSGLMSLSTVMTEADVDFAVERVTRAVHKMSS